jgi:hypothetical protein
MKHIQNDFMRLQLQNAMMAKEVAEAAKLRQAEKARAHAADAVEELQKQTEEQGIKKVPEKAGDEKGGPKERPKNFPKWRYRPDGTLEEDGGGPEEGPSPSSTRIDIKA